MPPPPPLSASRSGPGPSPRERDVGSIRPGSPNHFYRDAAPPGGYYQPPLRSIGSGEAAWSRRSPRLDERSLPPSGELGGHRGSIPRTERMPPSAGGYGPASAGPSSSGHKPDSDRLPPVSAIDPALAEAHQPAPSHDAYERNLPSGRAQGPQDSVRADEVGGGGGGSGAAHARSYSAREYAMGRGGIDGAARAPMRGDDPRSFASRAGTNGFPPRRGSGNATAHPYTYDDGYPSQPAPLPASASSAQPPPPPPPPGVRRIASDARGYPDAPYDAERREPLRRGGETPPPLPPSSRPLKRKPSFDDGPAPQRRTMYDPAGVAPSREREAPRDYHYLDRPAQPRSYARGPSSPERDVRAPYPPAYEASSYPSLPPRYAGDVEDPRYSPRHRPRSPLPASALGPSAAAVTSSDMYKGGRYGQHYDASGPAAPGGYMDRRSGGRYSPINSPSYAARRAVPAASMPPGAAGSLPPPPPGADYYGSSGPPAPRSGSLRHRSPPYAPDGRTYAPLPSSAAAGHPHVRGRRGSPPVEAMVRRSVSPVPAMHMSKEAFYPDRRFYYPRERIEDVEIDEYYHDGAGRARIPRGPPSQYAPAASAGPHPYPSSQDPYGPSPSASFLTPPAPLGAHQPGLRGHPAAIPVVVPPSHSSVPSAHHQYHPQHHQPPHHHHPHHDPRHYGHGHGGGLADYEIRHDLPPPNRPHSVVGVPPVPLHVPPGPASGIAPPPRRRGKLPKPVTDLLKSWLLDHASHPYPTEDEKRSLCSMTGLTLQQVSNWFINARRRILLPGTNGHPGGGATAEQVHAAFSQDSGSEG
ncbi:uncharacterized protein PFL1_06120 [Pseudozyma flocculosa PF-1]|uniref:Homeobox domain-containing protein n=1 Tax=Pseudozyma flocculosa PF-1 TaxID=1277687 RepID=A0A061H201_9BASI|nr:uncharacterized protein PFL1_06120 [Pseudozyma flocculosa PF-1]EPQ26184.1 hypothetical protein PFL1_06120 [Pseudozyma flocculosa PF-1]